MHFEIVTLDRCAQATGLVVVIDVLRAYTTAAFAFAAGAVEGILVGKVEEAFTLREKEPDRLLLGEVKGQLIPGFDFGNSPSALEGMDLTGKQFVQRTSAGTQGVVNSKQADRILTTSFVCAGATAAAIRRFEPDKATFVSTGVRPQYGWGDEDTACAEYLIALLRGENPAPRPYLDRVRDSVVGQMFGDPARPELPAADLTCALQLDRFDFAMQVFKQDGLHILRPVAGA